MKKILLNQWIAAAGIVALGFGCQSKKSENPSQNSNTESQCEQSCSDDSEDAEEPDDDMSALPQVQTEEKVSVEPVQTQELAPVQKQEESVSSPSLTESSAPESVSVNTSQEFIPELNLETLAKMFSIETENSVQEETVSQEEVK